jgi:hypothetical protein
VASSSADGCGPHAAHLLPLLLVGVTDAQPSVASLALGLVEEVSCGVLCVSLCVRSRVHLSVLLYCCWWTSQIYSLLCQLRLRLIGEVRWRAVVTCLCVCVCMCACVSVHTVVCGFANSKEFIL